MSMTIKEILADKKKVEAKINKLITDFEKQSELKVSYISRRTEKYDEKKRKHVKIKPTVTMEVNIENDPRSL